MEIWGEGNAGLEEGMVFLFFIFFFTKCFLWPWTLHVVGDDLELLSLLPPPDHWDYNHIS